MKSMCTLHHKQNSLQLVTFGNTLNPSWTSTELLVAAGAALVLRLKEARRRWAPLAALGATKRTKAQVAVLPPQLSAVALLFGCFFV